MRRVTIRTTRLPEGTLGAWDPDTDTIWLDSGLTHLEARCTLAHEMVHAERGHAACGDVWAEHLQERDAEHTAAARLISTQQLVDALRVRWDAAGLCELLQVDADMLDARMTGMSTAERTVILGHLWAAAAGEKSA